MASLQGIGLESGTIKMDNHTAKDNPITVKDQRSEGDEGSTEPALIKNDCDSENLENSDDDSITVVKEETIKPVKVKEERLSDNVAACSSKGSSKKDYRPMNIKEEQIDKNPVWWTPELTEMKSEYKKLKQRFYRNQTEKTTKEYKEIEKKYKRLIKKCQPKDWKKSEIKQIKVVTKEDKIKREKEQRRVEKRKKKLATYDFEGKPKPTSSELKTWGYTKKMEYLKYIKKEKQREGLCKYREQKEKQRNLPNGRTNLYNYP